MCRVGGDGPCPLYDPRTRLCRAHSVKPAICRVFYCTLFAEKSGELLIKARGSRGPVYRPVNASIDELRRLARDFVRVLAERL